jgi:hypothetical protein
MILDPLPFSPQLVHARWAFGLLPNEELPRFAQDALEIGYDGKYIRRIAGLIEPNWFDLQPLITGFFAELGIEANLAQEQAGRVLAHLIAQAIVEGQVRPYEGARFIAYEVANSLWGNDLRREFVPFIGLASEYEDCEHYIQHPEDCRFLSQTPAEIRRELEHQIIEAARNFVNNPGGG